MSSYKLLSYLLLIYNKIIFKNVKKNSNLLNIFKYKKYILITNKYI